MYIVDNYEKLCNKQDLIDMLEEQVKNDLLQNNEDIDIVESDLRFLKRLYTGNMSDKEIISELQLYGFSIVKLSDLKFDLQLLKDYFEMNNKIEEYNCIENAIKTII